MSATIGVFGLDDRTPVANSGARPNDGIAYIQGVFPDGQAYSATGFFIDPIHLVTAGHVVYDQADGGWTAGLTVTPGKNGATQAGPTLAVTRFAIDPAWASVQDEGYDYAVLTVANPAGFTPTTFSLYATGAASSYAGMAATTAGYPGEKGDGQEQYTVSGQIDSADSTELYSTHLDISPGDSGSPVYRTDPVTGRPEALGVVAWASTETDGYTRLTPDAVGQIAQYVAAQDRASGQTSGVAIATTEIGPYVGGVDTGYYAMVYADSDRAGTGTGAATDYDRFGWREGRNPNSLFDTQYYLAHNPDVAAAGIDPLLHYELFGWREGRDPSASFSGSDYLARNADARRSGQSPMDYYLTVGLARNEVV